MLSIKTYGPKDVLFQAGTILWRPVNFEFDDKGNISEANLLNIEFKKTERQCFCRTTITNHNYMFEPVLSDRLGIVVFIDTPPSNNNWTHLIVNGVSKPLTYEQRGDPKGAIFGTLDRPFSVKEYLDFRIDIANEILLEEENNINLSFDERVAICTEVLPPGYRASLKRLICAVNEETDCYEYIHFVDRVKQEEAGD